MFEEWNISTHIFFENLTLSTETEHSILEFMSDSLKFQKLPKEADSFLGFQITFWVFLTWRCVFAVTKLGFLKQHLDESSSPSMSRCKGLSHIRSRSANPARLWYQAEPKFESPPTWMKCASTTCVQHWQWPLVHTGSYPVNPHQI